jgi:hypothetical protein
VFLINQNEVFDMSEMNKPQHVIQELIASGVIQSVKAVPAALAEGYNLFCYDKRSAVVAVLEAQRGEQRTFKTLDAVAVLVKKLGLKAFDVVIRT